MPQYVSLIKYTPQGLTRMKESPSRLDTAKKAAEKLGGKFIAFYLTVGRYDALSITEFPNDEIATKFLLAVVGQGNLTTETMKAFNEAEYRNLVEALP
jgi:uncharacterized protein with GYD domain